MENFSISHLCEIFVVHLRYSNKTRTYDEDDSLKGYVLTLQRFEDLLKEGVADGSVIITESEIETDKTFDL